MSRGHSPDLPPAQTPNGESEASAGASAGGVPRAVHVAVTAVWRRADREGRPVIEVLAARRHAHAIRGGLWELPGGKIEVGETPESAARREVAEETGIVLGSVEPLGLVDHHDRSATEDLRGESRVRLHAVLAQVSSTIEAKPLASAECRWVPLEEFDRYEWPPANARLNAMVKRALADRAEVAQAPADAPRADNAT
jgi:8-oxo-dGTP diphosphatase